MEHFHLLKVGCKVSMLLKVGCKVSMLLKVGCKVSICLRESFHLLGKFDQPCVLHAIIHYLMM